VTTPSALMLAHGSDEDGGVAVQEMFCPLRVMVLFLNSW
jgi:hypothetical protein